MKRYNPAEIEPKWQQAWAEQNVYKADDTSDKPEYYALSFFPYPSGIGLHLGHTRNLSITDVVARYKRMQGYNVLHPMGWDSFGLPAENYAIKTGISPQQSTKQNTDNFRRQCERLGLSIDWPRVFGSTDVEYYKWTQWFFLLLYKRGLAYQQESAQFWCPKCKTVLANEQVVNGGFCWRHEDTRVEKKLLKQWFFKITDYADRLLTDLDALDWPEGIKLMQRNWIGRSKGAEIDFTISGQAEVLKVFTTRADTLFGATFMVLAPEHPLVTQITSQEQRQAVEAYVREAQAKTELDRMETNREKTGVFTGSYAINPVTNEEIPIWIADYVLMGYGTGAIMAVPAHDERDYEFAKKFNLPIVEVIEPETGTLKDSCYHGEGKIVNSSAYNGLSSALVRERTVEDLAQQGIAKERINYKLRDWLISRQRYWGAPIPIIHCPKDGAVPVPEDQLPVELPILDDFAPSGNGHSPLAKVDEWVNTTCPDCNGPAKRETDTMDGFACSSWYFLRFADPHNNQQPFSKELAEKWLPVDMYVGGAEHAVMHLLYARMWTKVMQDAGLITFDEPFKALRNQGMLLATDGSKFSKSKGNDIKPEEIIDSGYGADALRTIVLFLAPFDQSVPWSNSGLAGVHRFLNRFWTLAQEVAENYAINDEHKVTDDTELIRIIHKTIKKVTQDLEDMGFNTAIAALMEAVNELYKLRQTVPMKVHGQSWAWAIKTLSQLLAPFAPHLADEIWHQFDETDTAGSVHTGDWPTWDETYLIEKTITIVVQVNGKVRANLQLPAEASEEDIKKAALADEHVQTFVGGKEPKRLVCVPNKLINIVI